MYKQILMQNAEIKILIYYDGPQLLKISLGDRVFVAVAIPGRGYPFLCIEITEQQYLDYMERKIDLRQLFLNPKGGTYFTFDLYYIKNNQELLISQIAIQEDWLPLNGVFSDCHTEQGEIP